jgi:hypothetical protein
VNNNVREDSIMKRITVMISAVLCFFSATMICAADVVKRKVPRQSGKESIKTGDKSGKDKLKQNNPPVNKAKPKASGDPHVEDDPIGTKSGKPTN